MLLKFEAKAEVMSSVSPFLISVFAAIRGLGLLPSVFRLGFGFGFFFFWSIRGLWVCYYFLGLPYVVFFFRLVLLSHLLFRIDVGLWALGLLCYSFCSWEHPALNVASPLPTPLPQTRAKSVIASQIGDQSSPLPHQSDRRSE